VPVDVLGDRLELVVGEAPERVLHELEVVVEVARALLAGERREERRVAVGAAEVARAVEGAGLDPPHGLPAEQPAGQLPDGVGDERAGDLGLELAVGAVVEHRASGLHRRRGVGEVVAEHLVLVGAATRLERAGAGIDDPTGEIHGLRRGGEVRGGHGGRG
jgi:hypothetical protein